jgi:uncharacterized membrane protein
MSEPSPVTAAAGGTAVSPATDPAAPDPPPTEAGDFTSDSYEVRAAAVERLTFFADAVVAIAITLLALDLPLPEGDTNHELLASVVEHRDEYLAFLISFTVIGGHWRAHHRVFRYVTMLGGRLPRLTLTWLLMQVLTPFATRVLTGDGAFQARFIFYSGIQALAGVLFLLILNEIRRYHLTRPDTPPDLLRLSNFRTAVIAAAFLISIPISFATEWAYACWVAVPFVTGFARRFAARRAAQRAA